MATTNTETNYHLHLKGFVGGYDFDADYVDYILSKNKGEEVYVLIDSLGGRSNTALSIFSAFKRHGNVNVHFVGMNASAATIASLGAKHITMDSSAMYLVHKCSVGFFEWGQLNSDGLQALIDNIEHQKADLDKLDANIAQMYATRCKKEKKDLLELMKVGGWLTAQEALAWGFVDELTDYEEEEPPVLTDTMASAMSAAGIPVPDMPRMHLTSLEQSTFTKFMSALTQYFTHSKKSELFNSQSINPMKKIFKSICAILSCEHFMSMDGKITLSDAQLDTIESAISADKQTISDLKEQIQTLTSEKQALSDVNTQLQAEVSELKKKPADTTAQVVNDKHNQQPAEKSDAEQYFESRANAQALFDELP
ncbi:ATP-dependent Clp protease proteolytic subunit [Prevotella sp. P6B1]|uniref:ATP-dependent Clp protease proteolytic subunit n=1 Tax=Prevotella sp. P6B1 TaxID=1410613 RepID=UPI00051BBC87|nr:ATP-dependent Clp protease proteolytic subunit [Prevotella sp. P6B1]